MSNETSDFIEALFGSRKKARCDQVQIRRSNMLNWEWESVSFFFGWPTAVVSAKSDGVLKVGTSRFWNRRFDDGSTCCVVIVEFVRQELLRKL